MKKKIFLFTELLRRDLTARYAGSFGGPLWAVANPLILCALYGFVFTVLLKQRPPAGFPAGYAEFLLGGMLPWIGVAEALSRSSTAISDQAHLVKKLSFPLELLVLTSIASALVIEAAGLGLLSGFVLVTGRGTVQPVFLVLAAVFQVALLAGPCLFLAALNVFFRDLAQLLPPGLTVVMFLSPILYPESNVPAPARFLLVLNPVRDLAALFRAGLFGAPGPDPARLAVWFALFLVIAYGGAKFFRRCRPGFADLL